MHEKFLIKAFQTYFYSTLSNVAFLFDFESCGDRNRSAFNFEGSEFLQLLQTFMKSSGLLKHWLVFVSLDYVMGDQDLWWSAIGPKFWKILRFFCLTNCKPLLVRNESWLPMMDLDSEITFRI